MQNLPLMTPQLADALVMQAATMSPSAIATLQMERLLILLHHARQYSPYLKEKYAHLPACPELLDIPITLREEAMPMLEQWVCDPRITSSELDNHLAQLDESSVNSLFLDRYRVLTTSGTTGVPLRMVRDERHNLIHAALLNQRLLAGSKTTGNPILTKPYPRTAGVLAGGGYHSTYLSFLRAKKSYEAAGFGSDIIPLFIELSTREMVERLNDFKPSLLTGYPSNIRLLASQQRLGKLNIEPDLIACSAEHLSLDDIAYIEESFACPVLNNYCSTEGGEAASLCKENHMHINSDWLIIEPVDQDMRPVGPGIESNGVLLTNLANLVQPIIRYYISDRIILHHEPCACGSPFPYIDIEGRKEDMLSFEGKDGIWTGVSSAQFIAISMDTPNCAQVQFIQRGPARMEIRCVSADDQGHQELCSSLVALAKDRLKGEGLDHVEVWASSEKPLLGKSGKMRNILRLMDDQ